LLRCRIKVEQFQQLSAGGIKLAISVQAPALRAIQEHDISEDEMKKTLLAAAIALAMGSAFAQETPPT